MIFVIVKTFEILVPDSRCKLFDQYRYCRLKQEYYVNWESVKHLPPQIGSRPVHCPVPTHALERSPLINVYPTSHVYVTVAPTLVLLYVLMECATDPGSEHVISGYMN